MLSMTGSLKMIFNITDIKVSLSDSMRLDVECLDCIFIRSINDKMSQISSRMTYYCTNSK